MRGSREKTVSHCTRRNVKSSGNSYTLAFVLYYVLERTTPLVAFSSFNASREIVRPIIHFFCRKNPMESIFATEIYLFKMHRVHNLFRADRLSWDPVLYIFIFLKPYSSVFTFSPARRLAVRFVYPIYVYPRGTRMLHLLFRSI